MARCPFFPVCPTAASRRIHPAVFSDHDYGIRIGSLPFEGEPRTLCLRDPTPNVVAFGKQQITGDSRECAAYFPFMTVSGQPGANGCMFEYVAVGLQSSHLIVWEQE